MSVDVQATPTQREARQDDTPAADPVAQRPTARGKAFEGLWIIALLGLLGVAIPVLVARHYGALGIPRSDDWSYLLTLFRWVDTGQLTFNGWVSMTLVGQIAIAAPVAAIAGRSITSVQLFTASLGLVGLVAVVFIGRQTVRPLWWAVFVAATIAAGPLWGPLAPTFMTDIPTFTFEMLTLAAAVYAFRRRPVALGPFAVCLALGFVGVSIRQYAAIPVIAIVLVAVSLLVGAKDWRRLRIVLVMAAGFGIATLAILSWWTGLPDSKSLSPTFPDAHMVSATFIKDAGFLRLAGLLLLPVVVLAGPIAIFRRAWRSSANLTTVMTTLMTIWLAAMYARIPETPFVGNYIAREGVLSIVVLSGDRPDVIPSQLFDLLVVLGSISGMLIVLAAVPFLKDLGRRIRERDFVPAESPIAAVMGLTLVGFAVAYSLATLTGLPVYDRYALPVLPLVAFLVLRTAQREPVAVRDARPKLAWAGVAIVALGVLGFAFTVDSASYDGTRWKVAEMATAKGYEPIQIGGGFEWLGYHREHGPRFGLEFAKVNGGRSKFIRPCISVVVNPKHPGRRTIVAQAQSSAFSRKPVWIVASRNRRPCVSQKGGAAPAPGDDSKPIATATP